jgi:DNA excision repair protein ERCC-8
VVRRSWPDAPTPGPGSGSAQGHRFGVTGLSFYPFDSAAFLSCSHDQTLKLWSTERASVSGSFDLGAKAYTHATSPIASHLLVACGTQHPAVRLVDLRSAAAVQSLVSPGQIGGSAGATLAVAWSPAHEHVLASGAVDGAVRIWDVRKANALVDLLDQEDIIGLATTTTTDPKIMGPLQQQARQPRLSAKAHDGPVNGLTWTDDGSYLVSAGHDRRVRVWDAATGANTLADFGPTIRNCQVGNLTMFVSPTGLTPPGGELLFFPNETEILVMDLHEGSIVTRLRGMRPTQLTSVGTAGGGERAVRNRVTSSMYPLYTFHSHCASHLREVRCSLTMPLLKLCGEDLVGVGAAAVWPWEGATSLVPSTAGTSMGRSEPGSRACKVRKTRQKIGRRRMRMPLPLRSGRLSTMHIEV